MPSVPVGANRGSTDKVGLAFAFAVGHGMLVSCSAGPRILPLPQTGSTFNLVWDCTGHLMR